MNSAIKLSGNFDSIKLFDYFRGFQFPERHSENSKYTEGVYDFYRNYDCSKIPLANMETLNDNYP